MRRNASGRLPVQTFLSRFSPLLALVTRPREDAQATAGLLQQRGYDVLIEPLMDVVNMPQDLPALDGVQGILATSANGVRALGQATAERSIPIWAVGDATGRTAAELGFSRVESAGGDVDKLTWLVMDRVSPKAGSLLHVAGTDVAGDLSGALSRVGYQVQRAVLYRTQKAARFSPEATQALSDGNVDLALFYSPRTAQIFVELATAAKIRDELSGARAVALSQAVAQKLAALSWRNVIVAEHPTQDHLFAALDRTPFQAD